MSDLIDRLRKRAEIRRQIVTRKSVQDGKADRIADLLEEAACEIEKLQRQADTQNNTVSEQFRLANNLGQ